MDNIQNNIIKKDKIFEEMKKRRERISYLSDNSKRILSQSRERNRSNERLNIVNSSKSDIKDTSSSQKTAFYEIPLRSVHERLFKERSVLDQNRSMMQFKENMKIKRMVKYGSRSRSSSQRRELLTKLMNSSKSTLNINSNLTSVKGTTGSMISHNDKANNSKSKEPIETDACFISNKLYEDAIRRLENQKK